MTSGLKQSLDREGLDWRSQLSVFLFAALVIVCRRPDVLLNPQFWAEEGTMLFSQAYNLGWLHALAIPQAGYLHIFPRLIASVALLVPLRFAPLVLNFTGLIIQVLPVMLLLSSRCAAWGSLPVRFAYSALYLALPNSWEVNVNLTCSQFHLTLATLLIILGRPPETHWWQVFDVALVSATGMTGPFAILLLPISVVFWWLRRSPWILVLASILALCAAVQALTLLTYHGVGARVYQGPLGATPQRLLRILSGQIFTGVFFGQNSLGLNGNPVVLSLITVVGVSFLLYVFIKTHFELKLFISFCFLLLAASLAKPYIEGDVPQWVLLLRAQGCRYWLFPMLAVVWSLVWSVRQAPARWVRTVAFVALCLMSIGTVRDWSYPPYPDKHFRQYADRFTAAPPGTAVTIPINPDGWFVRLVRK